MPKIMEIINEAYTVETGDSGVAFKNELRYPNINELEQNLDDFYVMKLDMKDEIIGLVKAMKIDQDTIDIGPFAVNPRFQVHSLLVW